MTCIKLCTAHILCENVALSSAKSTRHVYTFMQRLLFIVINDNDIIIFHGSFMRWLQYRVMWPAAGSKTFYTTGVVVNSDIYASIRPTRIQASASGHLLWRHCCCCCIGLRLQNSSCHSARPHDFSISLHKVSYLHIAVTRLNGFGACRTTVWSKISDVLNEL